MIQSVLAGFIATPSQAGRPAPLGLLRREHWGKTLFGCPDQRRDQRGAIAAPWLTPPAAPARRAGRQWARSRAPACPVELRQLDHDGQAEARAGLGLVQPAAAIAHLLALLR